MCGSAIGIIRHVPLDFAKNMFEVSDGLESEVKTDRLRVLVVADEFVFSSYEIGGHPDFQTQFHGKAVLNAGECVILCLPLLRQHGRGPGKLFRKEYGLSDMHAAKVQRASIGRGHSVPVVMERGRRLGPRDGDGGLKTNEANSPRMATLSNGRGERAKIVHGPLSTATRSWA